MFIAAFEKNIECLENRFNQNGLEYYEALQQVLIIDIENYFKEMEPSSTKFFKNGVNQDSNSFNNVSWASQSLYDLFNSQRRSL